MLLHDARADVYLGWSDTDTPVYSDRPQTGFALFLDDGEPPSTAVRSSTGATSKTWREGMRRYSPFIAQAAAETALSPELLHAVVQVESAYNPIAMSSKGAVGLMQLMPATATRMGVTDRRDPLANLRGGARYLSQLVTLFDGELPLALAAYNAGEQAVQRHERKIPPYAETQAYVSAVLRRYAELSRIKAAHEHWRHLGDDLEAARELAKEDEAFAAEIPELEEALAEAQEKVRRLLIPRDPDDARDVILEIKGGEGGAESALFGADLLRMYLHYAESKGWKTEILEKDESDLGG